MPVRQDIAGRVLVVTLDEPGTRNALDTATISVLGGLFDDLARREPLPADARADHDIGPGGRHRPHAVVLRATGPVFCAGAHLGEMKALGAADHAENLAAATAMGAMFRAVRNCPVPVVGRVHGGAYGGGAGLVAACDIVVADPAAKFTFSEVKLGLVPSVISPLVSDRIGQAAARRYFLTAEIFSTAEAHRIGLVDVAAPAGGLDEAVGTMVNHLLAGGPAALGLCKGLIEGVAALGFNRSAEMTARMIAEARTGDEAQAALAAFLAREPAPWADDTPFVLPDLPEGAGS